MAEENQDEEKNEEEEEQDDEVKEEGNEEEEKQEGDNDDNNKKDTDEDEEVEVPEKFEDIVEEIEEMSVLDLSELVSILEDKFGVSASAPVAAAPAAGGASGGEDEGGEEQTEFDVVLEDFGDAKIQVIKAVKGATGMGLADAKSLVDDAPATVKEGLDKEEAEELKEELEEAGATVNLE